MIEVLSSAQLSIISIRIHRFPEQSRFARNQQALARVRNVFLQTSWSKFQKNLLALVVVRFGRPTLTQRMGYVDVTLKSIWMKPILRNNSTMSYVFVVSHPGGWRFYLDIQPLQQIPLHVTLHIRFRNDRLDTPNDSASCSSNISPKKVATLLYKQANDYSSGCRGGSPQQNRGVNEALHFTWQKPDFEAFESDFRCPEKFCHASHNMSQQDAWQQDDSGWLRFFDNISSNPKYSC